MVAYLIAVRYLAEAVTAQSSIARLVRARWAACVVVMCLLLSVAAFPRAATAQPKSPDGNEQAPSADSGDYREIIKDALREYGLGNWNEALALFNRAHALNPSARTLNGMGMASFENRQYVLTIGYLEEALRDTRNPVTAKQRREINDLLRRARGFVVELPVQITPDSAELFVDGSPAVRNAEGLVILDPGEHELDARAAGYASEVRRVRASAGNREPIQIALSATSVAPPPGTPDLAIGPPVLAAGDGGPPKQPDDGEVSHTKAGPTKRALTTIGVITAGAGVLVGLAAGTWAWGETQSLKDACPNDLCQPASRDAWDTANTMATVSTIGFSVAAAGLVLTAVGLVWPSSDVNDGPALSGSGFVVRF